MRDIFSKLHVAFSVGQSWPTITIINMCKPAEYPLPKDTFDFTTEIRIKPINPKMLNIAEELLGAFGQSSDTVAMSEYNAYLTLIDKLKAISDTTDSKKFSKYVDVVLEKLIELKDK